MPVKWKCQNCGELVEENFDRCWNCSTPDDGTTPRITANSDDEKASLTKCKPVSVIPYAISVPVLVVMAQSVWVVQGWNFRHNALLAQVFHPVVLGGMAIIAVISYFVIRPFVGQVSSRWIALLLCVLGFTILTMALLPAVAE